MRVVGLVLLAACRFGFDARPFDAQPDAIDAPPSCATPAVADQPSWHVPNDPGTSYPAPYQAFTISADLEVVHDEVTGLDWQRGVDTGTFTRDEAIAYCDALVLGGACDWRLPTRIELISIANYQIYNPAIDAVAFPGTPQEAFWSATPVANASTMGWRTTFTTGLDDTADITIKQRARCVRNTPATPPARFAVLATTAIDQGTGLEWQRVADTTGRMWSDAAAYCAGLGSGWRIPSIKELESLIDSTHANPALDPDAFPGEPGGGYWSGDLWQFDMTQGWGISFSTGVNIRALTLPLDVRCVR